MKVLLIQPNLGSGIDRTSHPHAGLAYLGAYSLAGGHDTHVIDARYDGVDNDEVLGRTLEIRPDLIGVTAKTPDIKEAEKLSARVKQRLPGARIVIGGAHVTGLRARVLEECENFDIAVHGEGEETFAEILDVVDAGSADGLEKVDGIVFRRNGDIVETPARPFIQDLDSLLMPAWQLFSLRGDLPLFSSRGCPYKCVFCQRIMGDKVRTMSPRRVVEEMKRNISDFNARFFQIEDEVFGLDRKWIDRTLDLMLENGLGEQIQWSANSRVNVANGEIYRKMKKAGCVNLDFGIESGNQEILDTVRKGFKLEQAIEAIRTAKDSGLTTNAFFILGHPGETAKTLRDTIGFARKLNPDEVCFGMMVPYPGTKIYEMAKNGEGGYTGFHENWELYTKYFGGGIALEGLGRDTLAKYQKMAYIVFYLGNFRFLDFWKFVRRYLSRPERS